MDECDFKTRKTAKLFLGPENLRFSRGLKLKPNKPRPLGRLEKLCFSGISEMLLHFLHFGNKEMLTAFPKCWSDSDFRVA
ncbi:MAG: hypothetical protein KAT91_01545 [Candidatus Aenigmarchaeota archaeon]|nr:hypothetical protein [Candidatus Aenigmarchaeota archaeon]